MLALEDKMWDPNTWEIDWGPRRIYGNDDLSVFALVDPEDHAWAVQWVWSMKWSRGRGKFYLRRNEQKGSKSKGRIQRTLFLHVAIMKRTGIVPPTLFHTLVDHRDGDSLNCQRANLRWATPAMNARNRFGSTADDHSY